MVDISAYISSLKLSWLKRIANECGLQKFIFDVFPMFINLITLGGEYVHVCMRHCNNLFWCDVLKHFRKLHVRCRPENITEFMAECIHFNVNILRDRKVVNVKEWINGNVLYVYQLFNYDAKRFLSFDEFKNQHPSFTKTNFLMYTGVIRSVQHYLVKTSISVDESYCIEQTKSWNVICKGSKKKIKEYFWRMMQYLLL